ncbi:PepSY-associated TM helix domain-containing protein [Paeniroseomonas aquatica]|uniref:PepSY-associated TM helix domain-containing protein n=1 Tax=Paeniroseomonas aquatica TaxID=373043 RepID=A0ABT8AEW6_9PROT|nr:PepSY-associated TM helix domain-containing protein [Paeniroseomonas aquatica]MDN3568302.1 PepSY-associated TM helix domain-containing protein [Paeniroseomonas aquatica]
MSAVLQDAAVARRSLTVSRALLLAHRWAGLVLGLVLVVIGVTGSILSFQREIDAALNPALYRPTGPANPELGYSAILRLAETATGRTAGTVRPPDAVWPVWIVSPPRVRGGASAPTAYLDPATGALLGERDGSGSFIAVTRQLHDTLLMRDWGGRDAVGWLGVLMVLFSASGIWLWWPNQGSLARALVTIRTRPSVVFNLDLHRVIGIWMAVVLAVVAFSGVVLIFPNWFRPLVGVASPAPGSPMLQAAPSQGGPAPRREPMRLDADAAAAAALAHLPGQVVTGVLLPTRQRQSWQVTTRPADSSPEVRARSFITIDPWSGEVLEERGPRTRSAGEEALAMQRWLHGGALLGWTGRLLVFLSGLAMPVLFVTGLAAWLLRRRNRRRLKPRSKEHPA